MDLQVLLQDGSPDWSQFGLMVVFAGALLEGETVVLLAGVLCHRGLLPLDWTVLVAALGAFTGDQVWFHLGRRYGTGVLKRFPRLAGHAGELRPWVEHRADWIAVTSRFVYGTRTVAPLLLGMNGYSATRFALVNAAGAALWAALVVGAGYLVGAGVEQLFGRVRHIELLLLLIGVLMMLRWWYRRRKAGDPSGKSA